MKRKIMEMGGKSLVITLPLEWAHSTGVKKGDEVDVSIRGKDVIVSGIKPSERKKLRIDTKESYFTKDYVGYLYKKGFDEVEIIYHDPKIYDLIKERVARCIGFEIVNKGEKSCIIKNISSEMEEEFDVVLQRLFHLIGEMGRLMVEFLEKKQFDRANEIAEMERLNDKLTDYCKRILNKKGYKEFEKTTYYYVLVRDLEKIADDYWSVFQRIAEYKAVSKETIAYLKKANAYFDLFHTLFNKFDVKKAEQFIGTKRELTLEGYELLKKNKDPVAICRLLSAIRTTRELYGPYFGMVV